MTIKKEPRQRSHSPGGYNIPIERKLSRLGVANEVIPDLLRVTQQYVDQKKEPNVGELIAELSRLKDRANDFWEALNEMSGEIHSGAFYPYCMAVEERADMQRKLERLMNYWQAEIDSLQPNHYSHPQMLPRLWITMIFAVLAGSGWSFLPQQWVKGGYFQRLASVIKVLNAQVPEEQRINTSSRLIKQMYGLK